jgi:malonate transporter
MTGVLLGFAVITVIILIGYVVGRTGVLGESAPFVFGRVAYYVLSPALLLTVLADADVQHLFSSLLVVSGLSAVLAYLLYLVIALVVLRKALPESMLGGLSASYVNAGNIGLPVASYILGDAALAVPVMLFQLVVMAPIVLTILDVRTSGSTSWRKVVLRPLTNPLLIASAVGVVLAVTQWPVPDVVLEPFRLIGAAAVPLVLISFGISLGGQRPLKPGSGRKEVLVASAIKLAAMPVFAYLLGALVFGMRGHQLFAVVVLAALPSAQNVFVYAQRYGRSLVTVRDTILITTIGSLPVLVAIAALLS